MAEEMTLPLLGYNGEDEEDDTTDSDGKYQKSFFSIFEKLKSETNVGLWTHRRH